MRRSLPIIATALAASLITAGLMQASAGAQVEPTLQPTGEPASRILGLELRLSTCNASPSNASAWSKFARCATHNFVAIKKWSNKLDRCMTTFQVANRNDDLYDDGAGGTEVGSGLANSDGTGSFRYFMGWEQMGGCPVT